MGGMDPASSLALVFDPAQILLAQGLDPDPWQREFLLSVERQVLLNCCRQSGKSTTTAARALHTALVKPKSLILLLSPTQRQSTELFRKVRDAYDAVGRPVPALADARSQAHLELANGSRVVGLPSKEGNIRGYSRVALLLIDEAAKVHDDLYRAVRPMLAVSRGQIVCLSTPFGQQGFFFREWHSQHPWRRFRVPWTDCPRIEPAFIENEVASLGKSWVDQEYNCLFTALEGLVYPDFAHCLVDGPLPVPAGVRFVGGIDWGIRNPFAAIWGYVDPDDVLWLCWEHYMRNWSLRDNLDYVQTMHDRDPACPDPKRVTWYGDPSGAGEIREARLAGWKIIKGQNEIRLGIAAVTTRLRDGRLRVLRTACPELVKEATLYRYPTETERAVVGETPIDKYNHALGALRYLIARHDQMYIARLRKGRAVVVPDEDEGDGDLWT